MSTRLREKTVCVCIFYFFFAEIYTCNLRIYIYIKGKDVNTRAIPINQEERYENEKASEKCLGFLQT